MTVRYNTSGPSPAFSVLVGLQGGLCSLRRTSQNSHGPKGVWGLTGDRQVCWSNGCWKLRGRRAGPGQARTFGDWEECRRPRFVSAPPLDLVFARSSPGPDWWAGRWSCGWHRLSPFLLSRDGHQGGLVQELPYQCCGTWSWSWSWPLISASFMAGPLLAPPVCSP